MRIYLLPFVLLFILMLTISGCENVSEPELSTKQLQEFYPGDISKVDQIKIRSGSTGETKTITDQQQVQDWINKVRNIEMSRDPNQDGGVGFLFFVDLFEANDKKIRFGPNKNEGNYYIHNKELENEIRDLFEQSMDENTKTIDVNMVASEKTLPL